MATKRTTFSESNINVSANTSSLTINVYFSANNQTTYFDASIGVRLYCACNGVTKNQIVSHPRGGGVSASFTFDNIQHNSDGTKSVAWNWTCTTPTAGLGTQSDSGTKALTTIPRASSFKVSNAIIGSNATITISRANSNFKHTLTYSFGSLTGTIASNVDLTTSWTIPTTFYNQIPNSKKGNCTITCITYNGTSEIGRSSQTIEILCNENDCVPNLTASIVDVNSKTIALTGNSSKLIKYVSTARITPQATAKNGAKISTITIAGVSVTNYRDILNVNTNLFNVIATDSRGYSKSITVTTEMINYVQLTCNATIKRISQTVGQIKLDYSGNYFNGNLGNTPNTLAISWSYREKGTTNWISLGTLTPKLTGNTYTGSVVSEDLFDYQKDYEFIIYVSDKLSNANINNISIYKSVPTFAIASDGIIINGNFFTLEIFKNLINEAILERDKKKYHVGALVFNTSGTNPKDYLGFGTWVLWGAGKVPVGIDTTQTEFNAVEKTGGSKTHTLTIEEMPSHEHYINWNYKTGSAASGEGVKYIPTEISWEANPTMETNAVGGNQPYNIMPPYITCYIWKRTA